MDNIVETVENDLGYLQPWAKLWETLALATVHGAGWTPASRARIGRRKLPKNSCNALMSLASSPFGLPTRFGNIASAYGFGALPFTPQGRSVPDPYSLRLGF
jgi:hypothetical protein